MYPFPMSVPTCSLPARVDGEQDGLKLSRVALQLLHGRSNLIPQSRYLIEVLRNGVELCEDLLFCRRRHGCNFER